MWRPERSYWSDWGKPSVNEPDPPNDLVPHTGPSDTSVGGCEASWTGLLIRIGLASKLLGFLRVCRFGRRGGDRVVPVAVKPLLLWALGLEGLVSLLVILSFPGVGVDVEWHGSSGRDWL